MDEITTSFQEITGETNSEEARHLIDACDGDLERAINLYFASRNRHNSGNPEDGEENGIIPLEQNEDDIQMVDATTNRRVTLDEVEDFVRAPIQPIHGPIIAPFRQTYRNQSHRAPNPIFEQYHDVEVVRNGTIQHASVKAEPDKDEQSNGNALEGDASSSSSAEPKARKLASLFRPPVELMYRGMWDGALEQARSQQRWLLVNIQKATEFACQVLNRDIWSNVAVRELIENNFVFWQIYHDSSDGVRICGYYGAKSFPAIFVVDPRTGEEVLKIKSTTPDPVTFLDQLTAFLTSYPDFEARDRIFSAIRAERVSPTEVGPHKRKAAVKQERKDGRTEDDFVAEQQAKKMKRVVTITDGDVADVGPSTSAASFGKSTRKTKKEDSTLLAIDPNEWMLHLTASPPPNSANRNQIILRLPNGRRETIELWSNAKLRALFSFVAAQGFDPAKHSLVMGYPKRVLSIADSQKTLKEVGFTAREMLHLEEE